jgi:hypothetical protein
MAVFIIPFVQFCVQQIRDERSVDPCDSRLNSPPGTGFWKPQAASRTIKL